MNQSDKYEIQQAVEGIKFATKGELNLITSEQAIYIKPQSRDKVSIIVCGRVGYEAMLGFLLGENMADAIITDPNMNPYAIMRTAISVDRGKGVLFICSYEEAERNAVLSAGGLLEEAGFNSEVVYAWDNVVPDTSEERGIQRASAGIFFCVKIAGAAAASGLSLRETYRLVREARNLIRSISVGVKKEQTPLAINSIFNLPEELDLDIGMPGDSGGKKLGLRSAEEIVNRMVYHLLLSSSIRYGDTVCAYISGFGGTCFSDLGRISFFLCKILGEKGIRVHDTVINPVAFKTEKKGATVSLMLMTNELKKYYDAPCRALYFRKE